MESQGSRFPGFDMLAEARRLQEGTARGFLALLRDTQTRFFLLTVLLGLGAGAVALGVRSLTMLVTHLVYARGPDILGAVRAAPA